MRLKIAKHEQLLNVTGMEVFIIRFFFLGLQFFIIFELKRLKV